MLWLLFSCQGDSKVGYVTAISYRAEERNFEISVTSMSNFGIAQISLSNPLN